MTRPLTVHPDMESYRLETPSAPHTSRTNPAREQHELHRLLGIIDDYRRRHQGNPPTIRDLMYACHCGASVTQRRLRVLERLGFVQRDPTQGSARVWRTDRP